ncbi:MAG TPA: hypothetical protein VHM19_20650, partial [Polyangiales bacterium]|nr:hypothetical protein [Polyangiales bacterium]
MEIATQSLLDSHVAGAGLASVLADRTLDHVWDGVFQHLALRAGPAQACELLSALESERERDAESDLAGSAGPRASLYRHIRRLVRCVPPLTPTSLHTTAWWRAPDARYAARLHALRHALVRTFSATRLEA